MHTLFIVFWATGDLAKRKLFPAWYEMFRKRKTFRKREKLSGKTDAEKDPDLDFLAIGRRDFTDSDFRSFLQGETENFIQKWTDFSDFLEHISYQKLEMNVPADYRGLSEKIRTLLLPNSQVVIYLSISPEFFGSFVDNFQALAIQASVKVVFEKPFGTDLASSRILNEKIRSVFSEDQIYRIDHYVGKEAIQNIFTLRFANVFFESVWDARFIDHIQITATESLGVGSRWGYYEKSGALRDMVQNHLFQVLSLVMMESPSKYHDEEIRAEKLRILKSLRLNSDFSKSAVFWQYEGYRDEPGVSSDSRTETFVALKLEVANRRWEGVPVYMKTGKSLDRKLTRIMIEFRDPPNHLFAWAGKTERNRVIIDVQPDESITIEFNVKEIWNSQKMRKVRSVSVSDQKGDEAYEKLLEDIVVGDRTLFVSFEMLEETWRIIDNLVHCKDDCPIIFPYVPGSVWPLAAVAMIEKDGREWFDE